MSQASSPQTTRPPLVSPTNIGSVPSVKQNKECGDAQHNCLDVERPDVCCDNSSYCFINLQNEARCCPIGSNCIADSPCSGKSYYCIITVTKTIRAPNGVGGANKTETATEMGCCSRKCPQPSDFLCPPDLGGKCCPLGSHCQSGGICAQTKMKATPTLSVPLSVAASSAACSSHAKSNGTSCPSATTTSEDGDEDEEEDGSDESDALSQVSVGIKAGIGLCASITVLVLLGAAFLYFRRRHRKRKNRRTISSSRAVLTRAALREDSRSDRDRRRRQQQAVVVLSSSEANDNNNNNNNSSPVEIASVEASSPVSKDRKYMKWASIVPECPGGAFELEGSHTFTTEDDVLPPPPPAPPLTCPPRIGRSSWRNYSPRRRG